MCVHSWEDPDVYQIWNVYQGNKNDWTKETRKKYPHKTNSNCHGGTTQRHSLPESARMFIHTYCTFFPVNKYLFCYFPSLWKFFSAKPKGWGSSLTTGLVARIWCSHQIDWILNLWLRTQALLQAKATWDHILHSTMSPMNSPLCPSCPYPWNEWRNEWRSSERV